MRGTAIAFIIAGTAAGLALGQAAPQKPDAFWRSVVRFLGISAQPSGLRADDGPGPESGSIWLAHLERRVVSQVTESRDYRSPLLLRGGNIVALRGEEIVELTQTGVETAKWTSSGTTKLVGIDPERPGVLLCLGREGQVFELKPGSSPAVRLLHDGAADANGPLPTTAQLAELQRWDRVYPGGMNLEVRPMFRRVGIVDFRWSDVFFGDSTCFSSMVANCHGLSPQPRVFHQLLDGHVIKLGL